MYMNKWKYYLNECKCVSFSVVRFAVLSALNWLKINGHLYPNGHPILYSSSEVCRY